MLETKIQESWANYREDFGLTRLVLFVSFFNVFIFFLSGIGYGNFYFPCLIPVVIGFLFLAFRHIFIKANKPILFLINSILLTFSVAFNYALMGKIDHLAGGLVLKDAWFAAIDLSLFGTPVAILFADLLRPFDLVGRVIYDLLIFIYLSYFILPIYGAILFYRQLPANYKFRVGRYFSSFIIYFSINFLCYLWVPVTGPQYFSRESFSRPLPLTSFGKSIYEFIQSSQQTFIDCFPSGHFGVTLLVTIWLFRINHGHRFIMLFVTVMMGLATLALRFHYSLDLVAALPLALICYKLGFMLFPVQVGPMTMRKL